jgi:RNA polymerase sigma-70 factor (ECF subfamily)
VGDVDADLVEALRRGAAEGPEQLFERHGDRVCRLALLITGVEEDAAEAVEETLRTAVHASHTLTGEPTFGPWIFRTAAKAAYQRLCARRPHVQEVALGDVVPPLDDDGHFKPMDDWSNRIGELAEQGALRAILSEAIDALPADCRTALVLYDVEGASTPDIAAILGVDVPAVESRVHRARLFVRKRLSEYFEAAAVV